jgi:hypothetical protein
MKYLLPLTLLVAAVFGAIRGDLFRGSASPFAGGSVPPKYGDPPWLAADWPGQGQSLTASSSCPIDEMAAAEGAYDGLEATGGDPHAASVGRAALLQAGLEPRSVLPSDAANGHTIADIHAKRASLSEHSIRVRGTVIKRTDGILGKSYVHLWDGSAGPETNADDLTITTTDEFQIGETVEVEGRLLVDRDLGLGYRYSALLDGATRVAAN